jgi:phosphoglucomutase
LEEKREMSAEGTDPRAGQLAEPGDLIDVDRLLAAYHDQRPDPEDPAQRVAFGTSGHRGSSLNGTFTDAHVAAISEAVCRYREVSGIDGPLFLGRDTHALSEPAARTIVEVLSAHDVDVVVDATGGATPTPVISHAILTHNRGEGRGSADGIVVTPSHNPPEDGGFKYNPTHGGPADTDVTGWIEDEANRLLREDLRGVRRVPFASARPHRRDYVSGYVDDLAAVIDLEAIRGSGLCLGVDPLGGASLDYWMAIAERHRLDLRVVSQELDPTFRFVPLDWDGKIRMDCSSPWAMSRLREMAGDFDVAFANDPDADRHGIVTPEAGLVNPNHVLAACIAYLFGGHRDWGADVGVGKTLVSSSMIDRVAADLGRRLVEVPVGFKWFVPGLLDGTLGFGGEESAGASFLRRDGTVWSTDKDGLIPCLLAAEMKATTGRDPGALYAGLAERFGHAAYTRIDVAASPAEKDVLKRLSPDRVPSSQLAGDPITEVLTTAPADPHPPIGGLKVVTERGWFAARPSGTENVYKIYAESMEGAEHLQRIVAEAEKIVSEALAAAGADRS